MINYSILINTCDAYSDVWPVLFRILEKTWPQAKEHKIYLNTESKQYNDSFFNVNVINSDHNPKNLWGKRLLDALNKIDSEYILFMLEDFFFEEPVLDDEINKGIEYMERYPDISVLGFTSQMECEDPVWCENNKEDRIPEYVLRRKRVDFKFNAHPAIWRKKVLKELTFNCDTPWGWEFFGNKRTWFSKHNIYGRIYSCPPVFVYDIYHGGAVHRGKWTADSVRRVIAKYGVDLDMNIRGVEEEKDFDPSGITPKPVYKRLHTILKNRMWSLYNMIYGFIKFGV